MSEISLETLVEQLREKRGGRGIRVVAEQIGISPATLSRVERGSLPDLETFRKICTWLEIDPGVILGFRTAPDVQPVVRVHFKKEVTVNRSTAKALSELILAAQAQMREEEGL